MSVLLSYINARLPELPAAACEAGQALQAQRPAKAGQHVN
jgi:hypothetical protein